MHKIVKPIVDSPIGWLGGKTKLRPLILSCIPKHKCYCEVFFGSGTLFFGKDPNISKIEIVNDINGELVNMMKVLSGTYFDDKIREEFIGYVRSMPAAREVFEDWKHWDEAKLNTLSPAQRAFRFYYCVKKGFSCVIKGGYEASPLSQNRYNMNSEFDHISARFRAKNAQIEKLDFRTFIEKYNNPRSESFFLADPPYFVANNTNYYEFVFTEQDHLDFKKCCDEIHQNNNKFLITYDDLPEVIELYKQYNVYRTHPVSYSAMQSEVERDAKKTELFITNYSVARMLKQKTNSQSDIYEEGNNDSKIEFNDCSSLETVHEYIHK